MSQASWLLILASVAQSGGGGSPPEPPTLCQPEVRRLEGGGNEATLAESWVHALQQVAACSSTPALQEACLVVQGHYGAQGVPEYAVQVFGSVRGAQMVRAGARASRVAAWLVEHGVAEERIRRLPPPPQATFRGVQVAIVPDCLPSPATAAGEQQGAGTEGRHDAPVPEPDAPPPLDAPAPEVHPWGRAWVGVAAVGDALQVQPEDVFAGAARLDAGWQHDVAYARLSGGPAFGTWIGQRRGFEAVAAAGWVPVSWLQLGTFYGYRLSAANFFAPWLERAWYVGLEAAQCSQPLGGTLRLCLLASAAPWGERTRRAVEGEDGNLYWVKERTGSLVRISLGLALRQLL